MTSEEKKIFCDNYFSDYKRKLIRLENLRKNRDYLIKTTAPKGYAKSTALSPVNIQRPARNTNIAYRQITDLAIITDEILELETRDSTSTRII